MFVDFPIVDLEKQTSGSRQRRVSYYQYVLGGWISESPEYADLLLHSDPIHVQIHDVSKTKVYTPRGLYICLVEQEDMFFSGTTRHMFFWDKASLVV